MAQLGADPEALTAFGNRLKQSAGEIEAMVNKLGGDLRGVWWKGPDAEQFLQEWDGTITTQLRNVCNLFEQAGNNAVRQASEQTQVSQA